MPRHTTPTDPQTSGFSPLAPHPVPPTPMPMPPQPIDPPLDAPASPEEQASFYGWFIQLCQQRRIDPSAVARACGFSHATITHWRKSGAAPQPTTCRQIATFFGQPYLLALQRAGHITADDLRVARDPDTLRLELRLADPRAAHALGATDADTLPAPEDPQPLSDAELVERAKLAIAQVPGLPQEAIANLTQLIDVYTSAAQTMQTLREHGQGQGGQGQGQGRDDPRR